MDTKQYVLDMLESLKGIRFPAFWRIQIINDGYADQFLLDTLKDIFVRAMQYTYDEKLKDKLEKSLKIIDHIQQMEQKSQENDDQDIHMLEDMIEKL